MPASDGKPEGNLEGKPEAASGNDHGITAALKELSIVIHNVPDFPEGSQILGLCSVTPENNDNNLQGWMVKDFLRWIRLFHKVGRRDAQKWLSFVDMVQ
ncbi:hypothetical protein P8C59_009421 [Phyllachora maydis]|uniref:Uncharacterized protein n=1 Tax=Phyllachora maydis TaxID=1825666 RepID=A0AAD9IF13_9PEZI|nr:hypothetical protein P8C59_009421 [Phyllachora maydis]